MTPKTEQMSGSEAKCMKVFLCNIELLDE